MNRDTMKQVLRELGLSAGKYIEFKDSGDNIQFCCPFHGETRPSCGINVYEEFGKCFACGETFNLAKLIAHCMEYKDLSGQYNYHRAHMWLEEKFNIDYKPIDTKPGGIIRIDDEDYEDRFIKKGRFELPKSYIAPFRGGKETHSYFFNRGFTKETMQTFKVGWDRQRLRVTIPVFWEDMTVCGCIGRAVLENKVKGKRNPKFYKHYKAEGNNDVKYYIYENFPVGDVIFPLPQFKPTEDGLAILVEGQFDCMWMHQNGHPETASTLGSKLAYNRRTGVSKQIEILRKYGVTKVLLMRDDDEAGHKGNAHDYELLKDDFAVYVSTYPEGKDDPKKLTKEEIEHMLANKRPFKSKKSIRRIT